MKLKDLLSQKKSELKALETRIAEGDAEAIKSGEELVTAIEEIEASIKSAEKAQAILASIGPEDNGETSASEDGMKSLFTQAKSVDRNVKGWSINADFKAATDVMTSVSIPKMILL